MKPEAGRGRIIRKLARGWAATVIAVAGLSGCGDQEEEAGLEPADAADSVEELIAEREFLDETVFAPEREAQRYEQAFVALWDGLRSGDPYDVLKRFQFDELVVGTPVPAANQPDWGVEGIRPADLAEPLRSLSHPDYVAQLERFQAAGWRIVQTEWHHAQFEPGGAEEPDRSLVSFEIHAQFRDESQPVIIRGKLRVTWKAGEEAVPQRIETRDVQLVARKGEPMFEEWSVFDPAREFPDRFPRVSPLLVHDLDGDGYSEVIAAGCNVVFRNRGRGVFERADFLGHPIVQPMEAGILADFTGDGILDYLGGSADEGKLLLFRGREGGSFPDPPVPCFAESLEHPHVFTAGDIDADGDLDLFVGQWKAPYAGGAMPTPYYDANDGHPDYLLRNDGEGIFTDVTTSAGLASSRDRRTFSASFFDFDGDHDLDLVRVADFAGLDLFRNDGKGGFSDETAALTDQRHAFGMSHSFDDWNGDGVLDLYMVGMSSTTARRLDGLGLGRPGYEKYSEMRMPMAFGNRLLLGTESGAFRQSPHAESAARTGWSWGCTSADFDLDGDSDLYVANGHLSGDSAKDYCTRFWCHDLYTGTSRPDPVIDKLFARELGTKLGREFSWNGFEHNVLFLNDPETGFFNAAFLLGVAFEYDSRAVVSEDLDADGRPDLLVVEYRTDTQSQRLRVYRNQYESGRHWIGLRLDRPPAGESAIGAVVSARAGSRVWRKPVVNGDSFTAQHSRTVHFGLGQLDELDRLSVRWPSGRETVIENPAVDQYHAIAP